MEKKDLKEMSLGELKTEAVALKLPFIGKTSEQLINSIQNFNISKTEKPVVFCKELKEKPFINQKNIRKLDSKVKKELNYNHKSIKETVYELRNKGYTIDDIVKETKFKRNTIYITLKRLILK